MYAHSKDGVDKAQWELLETHCRNVAVSVGERAAMFGAREIGEIAGWLHDLGKAKPRFQARLRGEAVSVAHSGEGARLAAERYAGLGRLAAFCIAGHHAGLANGVGRSDARPTTPLGERLRDAEQLDVPDWMDLPDPALPVPLVEAGPFPGFSLQFFTRMLFSALVDADFVETEAFYDPGKRLSSKTDLNCLISALDRHLDSFGPPENQVNRLRADVLEGAGAAARQAPGFFSLTVPTGGGKTLSSLKFALEHANRHGLRRVIHVAPFSAIIDQNADEFRNALQDDDAVLEHHTGFVAEDRLDETRAEQARLAAQNWDRPVVVTTAVQFFESLFANRTQRCRKLHNIARSVIVLDEAQSLPLAFLRPCLAALRELVGGYGCSVVLCTATQPALHDADGLAWPEALDKAATREIAPDPAALFARLKRVEVDQLGALDDATLVSQVRGRTGLVIVNNKRHARALFEALRAPGCYHLSTHMTARHRRHVLAEVRERLAADQPVLLVATALVEAGVDLDFPEVWRAAAGIDSIAQAAGRCNRNGQLKGLGRVHVFDPDPQFAPPPEIKKNVEVARTVLEQYPDPLLPEAITAYFRKLYADRGIAGDLDAKDVMERIAAAAGSLDFPFADIARDVRLIDDFTVPLIIAEGAFGMDDEAEKTLLFCDKAGAIARKLQRFSVSVTPRVRQKLVDVGAAEVIRPEVFADQFVVLRNARLYDPEAGFSDVEPEDLGTTVF